MIDRPAVSLRALALSAFVVLILAPESLLSAGFQMSFAATLALVAAYEAARRSRWMSPSRAIWRRIGRYALAIGFTTLIAGLATAPFAAEHFNRLSRYGFLANLAATPALGLWVAPSLAAAAAAAPFGLEGAPLAAAARGIDWILNVARFFAERPDAVRPVPASPAVAWLLIVSGGLWLCLWRGVIRRVGAVALVAGAALWIAGAPRPDVLIAPEGALVGVMTPEGRSLDSGARAAFAAGAWLRRDGDAARPREAARRPAWRRDEQWSEARLAGGWRILRLDGRVRRSAAASRCEPATILIAPALTLQADGDCLLFDRTRLRRAGAIAIRFAGGAPRVQAASDTGQRRIWTGGAYQ
jgi:competence protein ComEC